MGMEICIWIKVGKLETNIAVRKMITVIWVAYVQKSFQIRTLMKQLLTK